MSSSSSLTDYINPIFDSLDVNKDGVLTKEEFFQGMKRAKVPIEYQSKLLKRIDKTKDATISREEFYKYAENQLSKLHKTFDDLDINHDGQLNREEVMLALKNYEFSQQSLMIDKFFRTIDKNSDGIISFEEWRDFLLFAPKLEIEAICEYWQKNTVLLDLGDDTPLQLTQSLAEGKSSSILNFLKALAAGGLSGAISRTCTAPLERLKILFQVSTEKLSIVSAFKDIVKKEGVKGLFKGNFINVLKACPDKAIKFAAFEEAKNFLKARHPTTDITAFDIFLAGAIASTITHTVLYPIEVVRIRVSADTSNMYNGLFDCVKKIVKNEGPIRPFFKGLSASILSSVPMTGINLLLYDIVKEKLYGKDPQKPPSSAGIMFVGGSTAMISHFALYPFHVIKSRIIMHGVKKHKHHKETEIHDPKAGAMKILRKTFEKEGIAGFYKGFIPGLIKTVPAHAISFAVYEFFKIYLGVTKDKHGHGKGKKH